MRRGCVLRESPYLVATYAQMLMQPGTEITLAIIPARSKTEAMDWSLVLASQEIEAVIEFIPDGEGWILLVPPEAYERSLAAIRQYRLENRRWGWRQPVEWSGLLFHWGALLWCWVIVLFYWMAGTLGPSFERAGLMDNVLVKQGEWWRLFTAVSLHKDVGHLASNISAGIIVFGFAMARYGAGKALLATLLAGTGGNLAGLLIRTDPYHGLGASGMVMGALGLLAVQSAGSLRSSPHALRRAMMGISAGFLLFVLQGLNPASDVLAHTGGFVAGIALGGVLVLLPERLQANKTLDRTAGAAAIALLAFAWGMALR